MDGEILMENNMKSALKIKDTLSQDITRKINGVIKADKSQEKTVVTELTEYVVTEEVRKHLTKLFDKYTDSLVNDTEDMGVWISGFFGSGKSHFLKMIGHIIENKEHGGKKATEYFKNKIKDTILQGNLEKASEKPTDVILFNIDNVSDQDTFQNKDAIVVAFLKKFNEYQGFSRDDIKVAEFERMVWKKGKFEEFKNLFQEKTEDTWEEGRRNIDFNGDEFKDVVEELDILSRDSADRWLDKESIKSISAESFCELIEDYLTAKGKNHRMVFLVDEIGQYIGDNSQLMLNLQTLIELLGVKFQGRVWVGVTSQQDLGAILDSNDRKKNDFSKIQDRFKTMLPLSSGNIDEVIKKRLLEKKEIEYGDLERFYEKNRINIENLISFEKKGITLKLYDNKTDFAETYPFVGYQFSLLQTVFEKVRSMGHSGQHMSRGERSLLSSFQEAGMRIKDRAVGEVVPFNYFYESIEQFLEDTARRPFINAKNQRGVDEFGIEVLKLLFLLKGISGIEPNLNNLTSFMIDSVECDRVELEKKIKGALAKLEKEVLIQKDGDAYYFLTNEEQDINREILEERVDLNAQYKVLESYIFDDLYSKKSIVVDDTQNKYGFNKRIDEYSLGNNTGELNIVILTPNGDNYENLVLLGNREGYELIIKLPKGNVEYFNEIKYSIQVEEYIKKRNRDNTREAISQILESKQRENGNRKRRIQNEILRAFEECEVYIRGHKIETKGKDIVKIIDEALKASANDRFSNAKLITRKYDENKIRDLLLTTFDSKNQLININSDMEKNQNIKAINEVLNRIMNLNKRGETITLDKLVDYFTKAPYGWELFSVNGLIAELWVYKRITIEESKTTLTDSKVIANYLTKSQSKTLERLVITPKEEIDEELLKKSNNILKKIFGSDVEIKAESPKEDLFDILDKKKNIADGYLKECMQKKYPGEKALKNWIGILMDVLTLQGKNEKILKEFIEMEEELHDYFEKAEAVIDFFKSPKKEKFDLAIKKLNEIDDYAVYLGELKDQESCIRLKEIKEMETPYSSIREIDSLVVDLEEAKKEIFKKEKELLLDKTNNKFKRLQDIFKESEVFLKKCVNGIESFKKEIESVDDITLFQKERRLDNIISEIESEYRIHIKKLIENFEKEILEVAEKKDSVEDLIKRVSVAYKELKVEVDSKKLEDLDRVVKLAQNDKDEFISEANGKTVKKQRVTIKKISVKERDNLTTEIEVEKYIEELEKEIESLKNKMLQAIKENKIVDIN